MLSIDIDFICKFLCKISIKRGIKFLLSKISFYNIKCFI
nr:MAG TPA: hypothetical protein [Caudoviricetes sp.]